MKRGEIYYANLSPTVGSEMDKRRPVLIVSNDINNRAATTVTILPITSNISRVYPFEASGVFSNPSLPYYLKIRVGWDTQNTYQN
jgi:mRNA interferase MazF